MAMRDTDEVATLHSEMEGAGPPLGRMLAHAEFRTALLRMQSVLGTVFMCRIARCVKRVACGL